MTKKVTLATIAAQLETMDIHLEKNFAAVAEDISKLATKEQIISLHTQVNSIETQVRGMKHDKLETRVSDLETDVFGDSRAPQHRRR